MCAATNGLSIREYGKVLGFSEPDAQILSVAPCAQHVCCKLACAGHAGPIRYPGEVCASSTLASPCITKELLRSYLGQFTCPARAMKKLHCRNR